MKNAKKRNLLFILIISVTISLLLSLSAILNIVSFRNTYVDATASSSAIVASGTVNKIEYTLKYGKSLDNYYGIEELFEELQDLYGYLDLVYIARCDGTVLYETRFSAQAAPPAQLADMAGAALVDDSNQIWLEGETQHLLLPIRDRAGSPLAMLGLSYDVNILDTEIQPYVDSTVLYTGMAIAAGVCLLVLLFFLIRHGFRYKPLLMIVIAVVVAVNVFFGVAAYRVFSNGYLALTHHTSEIFHQKIRSDVEGVVSKGVNYHELTGMDKYFSDMVSRAEELQSIRLLTGDVAAESSDYVNAYPLTADSSGHAAQLAIEVSQQFVESKLSTIRIEIVVSIVTALMIAAEVIIFILAALTSQEKVTRLRAKRILKEKHQCYQPQGIVRGLSFFFSLFRYMAMAFVSLVIIDIYKPVVILGLELPYELVISLPLTAQMISSMLGSFISGKVSDRFGWKVSACAGVLLMAAGSLLSALSRSSLPFVGCQLIFGLGLGVAKTAVDLYAVMVSSEDKMEDYTSGANASCIVGLSCASAIGAIIAGALGYSGAYFVMAAMGILVALLILIFGQNIMGGEAEDVPTQEAPRQKKGVFDLQFVAYILFLVLPYYFVIMFVDYLFPVFANGQGMSTAQIGYVFLAYGVATSYIGTFLCRVLSKKIRTVLLMSSLVLALAAGLGVFSIYNNIALAIAMVLLIALCDGIMPSLQFKLVYDLPTTRKIGFSRALGIEGFFTGAISAIAPVVFSFVMTKGNLGFTIASSLVAACAILFGAINRKVKEGGSDHA